MRKSYRLMMKKSGFTSSLPVTSSYREFKDREIEEIVDKVEVMLKAWADKENLNLSERKTKKEHSLTKEIFKVQSTNITIEIAYGDPYYVDIYIQHDSESKKLIEELGHYVINLETKIDDLVMEEPS